MIDAHLTSGSKNKKIRIGIIGVGDTAIYHAKIWSAIDSVELIGVYSSKKLRSKFICEKYKCKVFSNVDDLMIECDLIDITTINSLHGYYALKSIDYNCHVVIEKPIDIDIEVAKEICKKIDNKNIVVRVISNYRFNCNYRRMKELLDAGKVGNIISGKVTVVWPRTREYYFSNGGWKTDIKKVGGGVLIHQCIHHIDLLHWLFGDIESLQGVSSDFIGDNIERTFSGEIMFKGGQKLELFFTTMPSDKSFEKVELKGSKGSIFASSSICYTSKLDKIYQTLSNNKCKDNLPEQFIEAISSIRGENYSNTSIKNGIRALDTILKLYGNKSSM